MGLSRASKVLALEMAKKHKPNHKMPNGKMMSEKEMEKMKHSIAGMSKKKK